jgi:septum formation protein
MTTPVKPPLILASGSAIRLRLLQAAGLAVEARPVRVDEEAIRLALAAEGARPRDVADTLAEMKARKVAERFPEALVLGCDQVLAFRGEVWGKPETPDAARQQLLRLRGATHGLLSAAVLYHEARPVWRHVGEVRLTMRAFSDAWLEDYLSRNWASIRESVGGYKLEEEGVRLFSAVEGDYFTVLGLPLLPLLCHLGDRGAIPA